MSTCTVRNKVKSDERFRYGDLADALLRRKLDASPGRKPSQDAVAKQRLAIAQRLEQRARELGLETRPVPTGLSAFRVGNRVVSTYVAANLADENGLSLDAVARTKVGRARVAEMVRQRAEVESAPGGSIEAFMGAYLGSLDVDGEGITQSLAEHLKGVDRRFFRGEWVDEPGTKGRGKVFVPAYVQAIADREGQALTAERTAEIRRTFRSLRRSYLDQVRRSRTVQADASARLRVPAQSVPDAASERLGAYVVVGDGESVPLSRGLRSRVYAS